MLSNRKLAVLTLMMIVPLVLAACGSAPEPEVIVQTVVVTAAPIVEKRDKEVSIIKPQAIGVAAVAQPVEESQTYNIGLFADISTTNYWASLDTEASVWNDYVLGHMHPVLYESAWPKNIYVPSLATELPQPVVREGDFWVTTATIHEGVMWSDGKEVTIHDLIFAAEVCLEFGLGGNWLTTCRPDYLDHMEAVNDHTVKIYFSREPDLPVWQFGVGLIPFMPEHFWTGAVEACRGTGDAATCLYSADGTGEPSAGPFIFETWEPGDYVELAANPFYFLAGSIWTFYDDGAFKKVNPTLGRDLCIYGDCRGDVDVEFIHGPFIANVVYTIHDTQDAAVQALTEGKVDFILNPQGLQPSIWDQVEGNTALSAIQNPSNGFRYLAFNMRKSPNDSKEFRQAVATLIDREFIADSVLQNSVLPVASLVPEGNAFWYNPGSTPIGRGMSRKERFDAARGLLQSAGFGWDIEPMWDAENEEVLAGTTLKQPDGSVLDEIELLVPSADYGPARAVAATWIAQWCNDMGIPVKPNPTSFTDIIPQVFEPAPDTGEIGYDWYILGWGLGSPIFPTFPEAFFACGNDAKKGGFNTPGYCDEEFDEMAAGMMSSRTLEEAREYVWAMDQKFAQDVPYVTLFTIPIVEFYAKTRVEYPYVDTLDGLQYHGGSPDLVTVR